MELNQEQKEQESQKRSSAASSQSNPQGGSALPSPLEELRNDERMDEDENDTPPDEVSTPAGDDSTIHSTITAPAERRATAMIKLRVWEPAHPHNRGKTMVATTVQLPANMISIAGGGPQHESGNSSRNISTQQIDPVLLSSVKEEPDKPSTRGDSYFDALENVGFSLLGQSTIDINDGRQIMPHHEQLKVGSKIAIRSSSADVVSQGSGMSVLSSASMGMKRPASWKVGNSAHLQPVQMLSIERFSGLRDLRFQIKHNSPNLHELVLDGLPPNSINLLDFESLMEALGQNESVKRLSMRNSNVTDEMASSLALALVTNTNLTQLSLEDNLLTNESAKNLYMVLNQNNSTLRLLDLTGNRRMDDDTIEAMDHFMEQRALKRTLRNEADKALRAAGGMLPDSTLEDNIDAARGLVTVVCFDGNFESDEGLSKKRRAKLDSLVGDRTNDQRVYESATSERNINVSYKPFSGEHSRDYTTRMNAQEFQTERDMSYRQSRPGAFSSSVDSSFDKRFVRKKSGEYRSSPYRQLDERRNMIAFDSAYSVNSSISSRSTSRPNAYVTDLDPRKRQQFDESDNLRQMTDRGTARPVAFANTTAETSHPSKSEGEKYEALSAHRYASTPTLTTRHGAQSVCAPPRRFTLDISGADYIDTDKTNEIELRRQLATEGGAIGAYQINEVAPSRQNRLSGNSSGRGARRGRVGRSESARMRRLAEIQGSDASGNGSTAINASNNTAGPISVEDGNEGVFDAEIQRADEFERSRRESVYSKSLRSLGLDDEEGTLTDRIVCGGLVMLLIGLVVLVVAFVLRK